MVKLIINDTKYRLYLLYFLTIVNIIDKYNFNEIQVNNKLNKDLFYE